MAHKASVTLGGVALAATSGQAWKLVAGTQPYVAIFQVGIREWGRINGMMGKPQVLSITDSRGKTITVKDVYPLYAAPSDSPHRACFVVADKRWKWSYKLVTRDYNMPRKTGDRDLKGNALPPQNRVVVDRYDYLPYSLNGDKMWKPSDAVVDVLKILEGEKGYKVAGFPIKDSDASGVGQFTLQGVSLRDQGDVALSRLLSYIPGADVYIDVDGKAIVFDATDLDAVEDYYRALPPIQWAGEAAAWVDRREVRPPEVVVHYQREVELLTEFRDDYGGGTAVQLQRDDPFLENVIPTTDPDTDLSEWDPESAGSAEDPKKVQAGTWVRVDNWLRAMDAQKPNGSFPWTFDTISKFWIHGDLDGALGGRGLDTDATKNVALRIQALKTHFRQTFRINRRYMERIRSLRAVRVALLDPVTGARAPAAVWGQAAVIPTTKGKLVTPRKGEGDQGVYRLLDYYPAGGKNTPDQPYGPARVSIIDEELGIFRIEWIADPYGLTGETIAPCLTVDETGASAVPTRDLSKQDDKPMGAGMLNEFGGCGIFLKDSLRLKVMLTIVPAAPNDETQFHQETVGAADVASVFQHEFRIQNGKGPKLGVFVPPGELTARFGWANDNPAGTTIKDLLGLRADNPNTEQIEGRIVGNDLPGFQLSNKDRSLRNHAVSVAAEMLAAWADNVQGSVVTVPGEEFKLVGNMAGATLRMGGYPGGKMDVVHQFPGQQRPISRLALMPESTRRIVLGTLPFRA